VAEMADEAAIVKNNVAAVMDSYITNQGRESDARRDPYSRRDLLLRAVDAATIYQDFAGVPPTLKLDALTAKLKAAQAEVAAADDRAALPPAVDKPPRKQ
jgi:hypothetical protein